MSEEQENISQIPSPGLLKSSDTASSSTVPSPEAQNNSLSKLSQVRSLISETTSEVGQRVSGGVERVRDIPQSARVQKIAQKAQSVASNAPQVAEQAILVSRAKRLEAEERNRHRTPIQRAFSTTLGKVAKTAIEMIPSPIAYGPGDLVTVVGALSGRDLLTGDHLDFGARVIYGIASAIPFVPATPLVWAVSMIRHGVEDTVHARTVGDKDTLMGGISETKRGVSELRNVIRDASNQPKK